LIFVALGTQKFQFNRLLQELDKIISKYQIKDEVVVQSGYTTYDSNNFKLRDFISENEFQKILVESDIFITHAGTSNVINALKRKKKVIVVPRLSKHGEHVDDHQLELAEFVKSNNLALVIKEIDDLHHGIVNIKGMQFDYYENDNQILINDIKEYILKESV
jgi:UDP-N-acetylglucosamine transferase subunit ALG13